MPIQINLVGKFISVSVEGRRKWRYWPAGNLQNLPLSWGLQTIPHSHDWHVGTDESQIIPHTYAWHVRSDKSQTIVHTHAWHVGSDESKTIPHTLDKNHVQIHNLCTRLVDQQIFAILMKRYQQMQFLTLFKKQTYHSTKNVLFFISLTFEQTK